MIVSGRPDPLRRFHWTGVGSLRRCLEKALLLTTVAGPRNHRYRHSHKGRVGFLPVRSPSSQRSALSSSPGATTIRPTSERVSSAAPRKAARPRRFRPLTPHRFLRLQAVLQHAMFRCPQATPRYLLESFSYYPPLCFCLPLLFYIFVASCFYLLGCALFFLQRLAFCWNQVFLSDFNRVSQYESRPPKQNHPGSNDR